MPKLKKGATPNELIKGVTANLIDAYRSSWGSNDHH
ncbi:hypothetical protein T01_5333 [Trichinella spiralis]|uniref:Uncharacterized protein n=1 Tax=Trichinella spiralis TaxID=6334 RepID=A0A0V0YWJ7_TRISP|nr:hypothetical protein T01_5333 [Trichinella spiralis]